MGRTMPQVGDAAYASFGQYGAIDVKSGVVTKITPSGQTTVDFGEVWHGDGKPRPRRFTANGWEIGGLGHFIDEDTFRRLNEKQKVASAISAVTHHLRAWSFKNKAEMLAFAARLNDLVAAVPDDGSTAASGMEARHGGNEVTSRSDDSMPDSIPMRFGR